MRIIIFFDLPSVTRKDKKQYMEFRKLLLFEGFVMMQESVYCKIALNNTTVKLIRNRIYKAQPKEGIVQLLVITEKQFSAIEYLCGKSQNKIEDSEKRLKII